MIELIQKAIGKKKANVVNCVNPQFMNAYDFAKEFKTIHLNLGRRSGKTAAMLQLCRPNDLIIVHNYNIASQIQKCNPPATVNSVQDVVLGATGLLGILKPREFDYVWIDEPRLCDVPDLNMIYKLINANLFIKLGE